MKKFKFTLQAVHNLREIKQEKEQLILGELQKDASKAADHAGEIEQMRSKAIERYAQRLERGETIDPFELDLNAKHIASLDRLLREAQQILEVKRQACRQQGKTVEAAVREVKITNRLRETQQTKHREEVAREEQNALDEIVSANYARRMSQAK